MMRTLSPPVLVRPRRFSTSPIRVHRRLRPHQPLSTFSGEDHCLRVRQKLVKYIVEYGTCVRGVLLAGVSRFPNSLCLAWSGGEAALPACLTRSSDTGGRGIIEYRDEG